MIRKITLTIIVFLSVRCSNNYKTKRGITTASNKQLTHNTRKSNSLNGFKIAKQLCLGYLITSCLESPSPVIAERQVKKIKAKGFNLKGTGIISTNDGGLFGYGNLDIYGAILKFNSKLKLKTFRAVSGVYDITDSYQDSSSRFFITGCSDFYNNTNCNIFAGRLNSTLESADCYEFTGERNDYSKFISETLDGNIIIGGSGQTSGEGMEDVFAISFSSNNIKYAYSYGTSALEKINSGSINSAGEVYLAGYVENFMDFIYLFKFEPTNGQPIDSFIINGTRNSRGINVFSTLDGGVAFIADSQSTSGKNTIILGKIDDTNSIEWMNEIYDSNNLIDYYATSIVQKNDGSYAFSGNVIDAENKKDPFGDVIEGILAANGGIIKLRSIGDRDLQESSEIIQDNENNLIISGTTNSDGNRLGYLLIQANKNGSSRCSSNLKFSVRDLSATWFIQDYPVILNNLTNFTATATKCPTSKLNKSVKKLDCSVKDKKKKLYELWWFWLAVIGGIALIIGLAFLIKHFVDSSKKKSNGEKVNDNEESSEESTASSTAEQQEREGSATPNTLENKESAGETHYVNYTENSMITDSTRIQLTDDI